MRGARCKDRLAALPLHLATDVLLVTMCSPASGAGRSGTNGCDAFGTPSARLRHASGEVASSESAMSVEVVPRTCTTPVRVTSMRVRGVGEGSALEVRGAGEPSPASRTRQRRLSPSPRFDEPVSPTGGSTATAPRQLPSHHN